MTLATNCPMLLTYQWSFFVSTLTSSLRACWATFLTRKLLLILKTDSPMDCHDMICEQWTFIAFTHSWNCLWASKINLNNNSSASPLYQNRRWCLKCCNLHKHCFTRRGRKESCPVNQGGGDKSGEIYIEFQMKLLLRE